MLRPLQINPRLSAYNQIFGNFDFNATPLAPPGCKAIFHESPTKRGTWASHGVIGYYCEPSWNHYRNFQCYIPETRGMRDGLTVDFFPKLVQMPQTSSADRLAACIEDMNHIINDPQPASPVNQLGTPINDAVRKLTVLFSPPKPKPVQEKHRFPRVAQKNHSSPRVQNNPSPRVAKTVIEIAEGTNQHPIGTIIRKNFKGKLYTGTVTRYNEEHKLYWIDYEDGNSEELYHKKVDQYKCTTSPDQARTRFTRSALANFITKIEQAELDEDKMYKPKPLPTVPLGLAYAVYDEESGKMIQMRELMRHRNPIIKREWTQAVSNEYGRLLKGIGMKRTGKSRVEGHDTIRPIRKSFIPSDKKVTYARFCCDQRPQKKEEPNRCRITAGGDRLDYEGETAVEVAGLETTKVHINSTISTPNARYAAGDISNMYTNSRLESPEFMRINLKDITDEVIEEYDLLSYLEPDGYVYFGIYGALYGLAQSGRIAYDDLKQNLEPHRYYPSQQTPGLWLHRTRPISFTLVVDDFGVKYINKKDADHLFDAIRAKYPVKIDWTGTKYLGIDLKWHYDRIHKKTVRHFINERI